MRQKRPPFYFRSDTRTPEEIFPNGLSPRLKSIIDSEWAMTCLSSITPKRLKKKGLNK